MAITNLQCMSSLICTLILLLLNVTVQRNNNPFNVFDLLT